MTRNQNKIKIQLKLIHKAVFDLLQDIAVMTNDVSRCHYYKQESQNVKSKWDCVFPQNIMNKFKVNKINIQLPNNKEDCEVG